MRVVLLSGGGGGARFARGLQDALGPGELTVVANVGDDVEVLGLHVSPDLDSLLYTLAGLIDETRGWLFIGHFTDSFITVISLDRRFPMTFGKTLATIGKPTPPRASK